MELAAILENDWWCTVKGSSAARTLERTNSGWLRSTALDGDVWNASDVAPIPYEFVIDTDTQFSGHIENLQLDSEGRSEWGKRGYVKFQYDQKWNTSFTNFTNRVFLSLRVLGVLVACWELYDCTTPGINDTFLITYKSFEKIDYRPPIVFETMTIFDDNYIRGTMKPKKWGTKVLHYLVSTKTNNAYSNHLAGIDELHAIMAYFKVDPSRFFIEVAKQYAPKTNP